MRSGILSGILCLLFIPGTFGQKSYEVKQEVLAMSKGEHTGFSITLEGRQEKETVKLMRDWLEEKQKKANITEPAKHEIMVSDFTCSEFGDTKGNIYFIFSEGKNSLTITGFFEMNEIYIASNTSADKVKNCEQFMQHFGYRIEKINIEEQLAEANKDLDKKNKEQDDLEKKNKQLNDQIKACEETIKEAKSSLEQNSKDQDLKKDEIGKQQEAIDLIKKNLELYSDY